MDLVETSSIGLYAAESLIRISARADKLVLSANERAEQARKRAAATEDDLILGIAIGGGAAAVLGVIAAGLIALAK